MKKVTQLLSINLTALVLSLSFVGVISTPVLADIQNPCDAGIGVNAGLCEEIPSSKGDTEKTALKKTVTDVVNWLLTFSGIIAVLFIIIGGIRYATSAGDPDKVKKAKNTLLYAIIGLAVALLAAVIVNAVIGIANNVQG